MRKCRRAPSRAGGRRGVGVRASCLDKEESGLTCGHCIFFLIVLFCLFVSKRLLQSRARGSKNERHIRAAFHVLKLPFCSWCKHPIVRGYTQDRIVLDCLRHLPEGQRCARRPTLCDRLDSSSASQRSAWTRVQSVKTRVSAENRCSTRV